VGYRRLGLASGIWWYCGVSFRVEERGVCSVCGGPSGTTLMQAWYFTLGNEGYLILHARRSRTKHKRDGGFMSS
jgi:hypothetical protein